MRPVVLLHKKHIWDIGKRKEQNKDCTGINTRKIIFIHHTQIDIKESSPSYTFHACLLCCVFLNWLELGATMLDTAPAFPDGIAMSALYLWCSRINAKSARNEHSPYMYVFAKRINKPYAGFVSCCLQTPYSEQQKRDKKLLTEYTIDVLCMCRDPQMEVNMQWKMLHWNCRLTSQQQRLNRVSCLVCQEFWCVFLPRKLEKYIAFNLIK